MVVVYVLMLLVAAALIYFSCGIVLMAWFVFCEKIELIETQNLSFKAMLLRWPWVLFNAFRTAWRQDGTKQ